MRESGLRTILGYASRPLTKQVRCCWTVTFFSGLGYTVNSLLDVTNLINERFEMPWGFRDPGFCLFAGLEAAIF